MSRGRRSRPRAVLTYVLPAGVSLNCKMNMEIAAEPSVRKLYVPPVPHDAGVALGAAMLKCAEAGHSIAPLTHAYWGPEYSNDTISSTLDKIGARYELVDDPSHVASAT